MRKIYLILAVIGAVVPYAFFIDFFQSNGVDLPAFMVGLFANGAAGGFSADLLISSFVFWILMFTQARKHDGPSPYLFIALNLTIGLSCALPAYLYARERAFERSR
ncbi:MAG: DUF2834 domain-containing protein [Candidatus Latescibacteria bacterium]|nr:DUF2834 domain-containing protein [Candidatus Latescibacterota bacterium]